MSMVQELLRAAADRHRRAGRAPAQPDAASDRHDDPDHRRGGIAHLDHPVRPVRPGAERPRAAPAPTTKFPNSCRLEALLLPHRSTPHLAYPAPVVALALSIPAGMTAAAGLIFMIMFLGGMFGVLRASGRAGCRYGAVARGHRRQRLSAGAGTDDRAVGRQHVPWADLGIPGADSDDAGAGGEVETRAAVRCCAGGDPGEAWLSGLGYQSAAAGDRAADRRRAGVQRRRVPPGDVGGVSRAGHGVSAVQRVAQRVFPRRRRFRGGEADRAAGRGAGRGGARHRCHRVWRGRAGVAQSATGGVLYRPGGG